MSHSYILGAMLSVIIYVILDPLPYRVHILIPIVQKRKQTHKIFFFQKLHKDSHVPHNAISV